MAKAKKKEQENTAQERVNQFAKLVQEASDLTGIGLGIRLLYAPDALKPDLYYVDLIEVERKKNEQAKNPVSSPTA